LVSCAGKNFWYITTTIERDNLLGKKSSPFIRNRREHGCGLLSLVELSIWYRFFLYFGIVFMMRVSYVGWVDIDVIGKEGQPPSLSRVRVVER
jgi:hypothetical protein